MKSRLVISTSAAAVCGAARYFASLTKGMCNMKSGGFLTGTERSWELPSP